MDHNCFIRMPDHLDITYSDLREDEKGQYVLIYFEQPNATKTDFNDATFRFPECSLIVNHGFSAQEETKLLQYVKQFGPCAFDFALEDSGRCLV